MSKPYITALLDSYNHEAFIEEAIAGVLAQDFPAPEMEILVVDDGSTDRTPEIVRKFEPRVRLLRKANGGQASAFNAGIPEARGEIVAFLDADDWWAPNKVRRVVDALASHPEAGIVGHSITEVMAGGSHRVEQHREDTSFPVDSVRGARLFRTRKNFLGTSRMTIRAGILRKILPVPEALVIQADEFVFTVAAVLSGVVVLREPLTFYRHHSSNAFMISSGDSGKLRVKMEVMNALAGTLSARLEQHDIPVPVRNAIVDAVELEASQLRLALEGGYPWETVRTELGLMRALYGDASFWQHAFSCARLLPAIAMPPQAYYRWRHRFTQAPLYQRLRRKFFPFPVPSHVHRKESRVHD